MGYDDRVSLLGAGRETQVFDSQSPRILFGAARIDFDCPRPGYSRAWGNPTVALASTDAESSN